MTERTHLQHESIFTAMFIVDVNSKWNVLWPEKRSRRCGYVMLTLQVLYTQNAHLATWIISAIL